MRDKGNLISKIHQTLEICDIHLKRLKFASGNLTELFPLNKSIYQNIKDEEITVLDQMIYRFTKLQDAMGSKLFPQTLMILQEDYSGKPFIDILLRLEKLELIPDHREWLRMREIRNQLAHEYPVEIPETVESLNELYGDVSTISRIYTDLKGYLVQRTQE